MKRNADLFFEVADRVEFDPASYCQKLWGRKLTPTMAKRMKQAPECGTRACIAGHALLCSGEFLVTTEGNFVRRDPELRASDRRAWRRVVPACEASHLLGLDWNESYILFHTDWEPRQDLTVAEALRRVGKGDSVASVTGPKLNYL